MLSRHIFEKHRSHRSDVALERLESDSDGILFGHTRRGSLSYEPGGRTYKSMNYHRHRGYKPGKTIWANSVSLIEEAGFFDSSDFMGWCSNRGDHWWVEKDADRVIGIAGELIAFFPTCTNYPGPWHGYPVSPRNDSSYQIPSELIELWEQNEVIDDLIAKRMRKGKT